MSNPICQPVLLWTRGITDDCHLDYKTPVMSAFCLWTDSWTYHVD
jgi:hypothetical protein